MNQNTLTLGEFDDQFRARRTEAIAHHGETTWVLAEYIDKGCGCGTTHTTTYKVVGMRYGQEIVLELQPWD